MCGAVEQYWKLEMQGYVLQIDILYYRSFNFCSHWLKLGYLFTFEHYHTYKAGLGEEAGIEGGRNSAKGGKVEG